MVSFRFVSEYLNGHCHLERETAGEKAEGEGEGEATEPREESNGANAGLSLESNKLRIWYYSKMRENTTLARNQTN